MMAEGTNFVQRKPNKKISLSIFTSCAAPDLCADPPITGCKCNQSETTCPMTNNLLAAVRLPEKVLCLLCVGQPAHTHTHTHSSPGGGGWEWEDGVCV